MTDAMLVAAAEAGDDAGFEALHRRHVLAAWRLAQAVTRDDVTAVEAVRKAIPAVFAAISRGSYPPGLPVRCAVLSATRAAAVSLLHGSTWTGRHQRRDVVDRAFSGLPECWRSALWLIEVERLTPIEAASPLGIPPGETVALTARARVGFRDRYIRIAGAGRSPECQRTLRLLPRAEAGDLAPHEVADLDQHLAGCRACRISSMDLATLSATLRRVALPTPVLTMAAPTPRQRLDLRRCAPALAAAVAAIFGLSSVGAVSHDGPKPAEQVASPIDADVPVRDSGTIPTVTNPRGAASAPVGAAAVAPGAVDLGVVAVATDAPPVAVAPWPRRQDRRPLAPATPAPQYKTPDSSAEPAPAPPSGSPDGEATDGTEGLPPPGQSEDVGVAVELADGQASVTADADSPTPVEADVAVPGPEAGLTAGVAGSEP